MNLDKFKKEELFDIGGILGDDFPMAMKKSQMVKHLGDYIRTNPERWLTHLMERDINLLRELVRVGPGRVQYVERADYLSIVEVSGIVESDNSADNYSRIWIDREMYDIVSPVIDKIFRRCEKNSQYRLERMGLGILNVYGIMPTLSFTNLLADWYDTCRFPDYEALRWFYENSPLMKMGRMTDIDGTDCICSPCVPDPDALLEVRKNSGISVFHKVSFKKYEQAGNGAPYFTVWMDSKYGKALHEVYSKLGYTGLELVRAEYDTWIESQFTDVSNPSLFNAIYAAPDADKVPDDVWEQYCMTVCDYADNVPKWSLCGKTAAATGVFLCNRDAWKETQEEDPMQDIPESEDYPRWTMPEPTVSEDYAALASLFPRGLVVPHVAPDDTCPCGSGLKYKNCHGKYLS